MKKNLLLIATAFCFVNISHAQISKGSVWLGGNLGFNTSNDYYTKSSAYNIYPAVGFAFKNNNVSGLELRFGGSHFESKYDTSKSTTKGIGLWDRQYWTIIKRLYVFADFKGSYDATKDDQGSAIGNSMHSTGWIVGLSASPGISFGVTKWFYLESGFNNLFYFNYNKKNNTSIDQSGKTTYDSHSASGGINLDGESAFVVGVRFLIAKG